MIFELSGMNNSATPHNFTVHRGIIPGLGIWQGLQYMVWNEKRGFINSTVVVCIPRCPQLKIKKGY
jgi:hypothetical protein